MPHRQHDLRDAGLSALAARRDHVAEHAIFARYSLAPVHARVPVVLLHGLVVSSAFHRRALRRVGNHRRAYAPDLPGYGLSSKPESVPGILEQARIVAAWMDALWLSGAVVAGVSMGTQYATALASERPDLVRGLVLASPTMEPRLRATPRAVGRWLLESRHELPMAGMAMRDYARTGMRRASETLRLALADRPEDRLAGLSMPTLVLRGSADHLVSHDWAADYTSRLPNGQLVEVPGVAHAMNFSAPDEFSRLVVAFATELEARAPAATGVAA